MARRAFPAAAPNLFFGFNLTDFIPEAKKRHHPYAFPNPQLRSFITNLCGFVKSAIYFDVEVKLAPTDLLLMPQGRLTQFSRFEVAARELSALGGTKKDWSVVYSKGLDAVAPRSGATRYRR